MIFDMDGATIWWWYHIIPADARARQKGTASPSRHSSPAPHSMPRIFSGSQANSFASPPRLAYARWQMPLLNERVFRYIPSASHHHFARIAFTALSPHGHNKRHATQKRNGDSAGQAAPSTDRLGVSEQEVSARAMPFIWLACWYWDDGSSHCTGEGAIYIRFLIFGDCYSLHIRWAWLINSFLSRYFALGISSTKCRCPRWPMIMLDCLLSICFFWHSPKRATRPLTTSISHWPAKILSVLILGLPLLPSFIWRFHDACHFMSCWFIFLSTEMRYFIYRFLPSCGFFLFPIGNIIFLMLRRVGSVRIFIYLPLRRGYLLFRLGFSYFHAWLTLHVAIIIFSDGQFLFYFASHAQEGHFSRAFSLVFYRHMWWFQSPRTRHLHTAPTCALPLPLFLSRRGSYHAISSLISRTFLKCTSRHFTEYYCHARSHAASSAGTWLSFMLGHYQEGGAHWAWDFSPTRCCFYI